MVTVGAAMAGVNIQRENAAAARTDAWLDFNRNAPGYNAIAMANAPFCKVKTRESPGDLINGID